MYSGTRCWSRARGGAGCAREMGISRNGTVRRYLTLSELGAHRHASRGSGRSSSAVQPRLNAAN